MSLSNKRINSNNRIDAIICADVKLHKQIEINIEFADNRLIHIDKSQKIRKRKIADLKKQIALLQGYIHDDEVETSSIYKGLLKDCNTFQKLETRINKNTDLQKWNILVNDSVQLLQSHKRTGIGTGIGTGKSIHTHIRALPDDLIRYIYNYLSYDNRISLLECKYRLYNRLLEHPNHIFRSIISRVIIQQHYCNICIDCPNKCYICPKCIFNGDNDNEIDTNNHTSTCIKKQCNLCKNCNDCIEIRERTRYIKCRSIKDISLVFRAFILKNKLLTPKKIYHVIRKTILLSIVQTKYNNK